jgi:hypothetical protein
MTSETIKALLMISLIGGIRSAIFVSGLQQSQITMFYRRILDRLMPSVAKLEQRHA